MKVDMSCPGTEELVKKFGAAGVRFELQVVTKSSEIDPEGDLDWFSLTVGWALANTMTPDDAHEFARFIRYYTDIG